MLRRIVSCDARGAENAVGSDSHGKDGNFCRWSYSNGVALAIILETSRGFGNARAHLGFVPSFFPV